MQNEYRKPVYDYLLGFGYNIKNYFPIFFKGLDVDFNYMWGVKLHDRVHLQV